MRYTVFVRNWWKPNPKWPGGREPHAGRKTVLRRGLTEQEAQQMCRNYRAEHDPGKWSRKAEYMEE